MASGTYIDNVWTYAGSFDAPPQYKQSCRYQAFVPSPLADFAVDLPGPLVRKLGEVEREIVHVQQLGANERALGAMARFMLRSESIASSKIEGLSTNTRTYLRDELRYHSGAKISKTSREIIGNVEAMELAVGELAAQETIPPESIMNLHTELLRESQPLIAGNIRESQNWIGGNNYNPCNADYVPPPAELVNDLVIDLCSFVSSAQLPSLVKAAIAHAQFELIHPFIDGNGRCGRALIHVILRKGFLEESFTLPLSIKFANSPRQYVEGLSQFRDGDILGWIEYFVECFGATAALSWWFARRVTEMHEGWQELLTQRGKRSDSVAWKVVDILPAYPVVTVPLLMAELNTARLSTYGAVEILEETGILEPVTSGSRNREWVPSGFPELLERFELGALKQGN